MNDETWQFDKQASPLYLPFFYFAFHPYQTVGIVTIMSALVGYIIGPDMALTFGIFGLIPASPIVWVASVFFVNSNYQELVNAFLDDAAENATEIFAGSAERPETFQIEHSFGSVNLVEPLQKHEPITVITGEGSLLIYDDASLRLDTLNVTLGKSTREIFYDSITSVNYDSPHFEVRLSDGDHAKYRSSRKPDDVLHELQQRLRNYKTSS